MTDTSRFVVDPSWPSDVLETSLVEAASILREGGLVAFPTETVYGLGANALCEQAVARIFEAKGRPGDNPLIVHIASMQELSSVVRSVPPSALLVAQAFWPGPLTVILPKQERIPRAVTAGLDTVAVRMPSHPVASALIRAAGIPIAAPSANASGRPSPTLASHVWHDLAGRIDMLIDGGPAGIGLESTVLDLASDTPMVLRPGGVSVEQLRALLPDVRTLGEYGGSESDGSEGSARSPGLKHRHYSPRAPLWLFIGDVHAQASRIAEEAGVAREKGQRVGLLVSEDCARLLAHLTPDLHDSTTTEITGLRDDLSAIASSLFQSMRDLDAAGVDLILAESYPTIGIGLAIMNRLVRAAGDRLVFVAERGRK